MSDSKNSSRKHFPSVVTITDTSSLDGSFTSASGGGFSDFCHGKHGSMKDRIGAKKFVNSRRRRKDRDYLQTMDIDNF